MSSSWRRDASQEPEAAALPIPLDTLRVPWIQHEQFTKLKWLTGLEDDQRGNLNKNSLAKVLREFKKGRAAIEQQIDAFSYQIDHLSRWIEDPTYVNLELVKQQKGPRTAMKQAKSARGFGQKASNALAASKSCDGTRTRVNESTKYALINQPDIDDPDAPCTSVGLWRFVDAFGFFAPLPSAVVEKCLRLEEVSMQPTDERTVECESTIKVRILQTEEPTAECHTTLHENGCRDLSSSSVLECALRERLVASLVPSSKCGSAQIVERGCQTKKTDERSLVSKLRSVGLLDCSDKEVEVSLLSAADDPISTRIRAVGKKLFEQIRWNNEMKRRLRVAMHEDLSWQMTSDEEAVVVRRYNKLRRRLKEAERKKQKQMKKQRRRRDLVAI